jgi:FkbM family methyltransferase
MNIFRQIQLDTPDVVPSCIFDIGANVGQTVREIRQVWPHVPVHAFEPVSATFATLQRNIAAETAVTAHKLAFAGRPGRANMLARPGNTMNRIVTRPEGKAPMEEVEVVTGDGFCAQHGIDRIDVLKIDTEGHDLDVLTGFRNMLAERRVSWVVAECAVAPDNTMHVPFGRIADFMFALGYGLFNLYPGMRLNVTLRRRDRGIWFGNAVFVAERWPEDAVYLP